MSNAQTPPPSVDLEALAYLSVLDGEDDPVRLGSLWSNQRVVLVFLPFLSTLLARERTAQVVAQLKTLRSFGAEVYLLGPNSSLAAERFEEEVRPGCALYVDPECRAYRAAGMRKQETWLNRVMQLPRVWMHLLSANAPDVERGVEFGGVLVILPPGRLAFAYTPERLDAPLLLQEAEETLKRAGWDHLYKS